MSTNHEASSLIYIVLPKSL